MPMTIRLSKIERQLLQEKAQVINEELISKSKTPVKESELLHIVLCNALQRTGVSKKGLIVLCDSPIIETKVQYY